jgi:hypothetical protein
MAYRASTNRSGEKCWRSDGDVIPATHTDVRPATDAEVALMDEIIQAKGTPPLALGERIKALLASA